LPGPFRSSLTAKTPKSKLPISATVFCTAAAPINPFCSPQATMTATKTTAQNGGYLKSFADNAW
jgi:hypothetical protein